MTRHVYRALHGDAQPVLLTSIGEGPVIHFSALTLDWGQIPVLTDKPKVIRLSNESVIPAKFSAHMVRFIFLYER